MEKLKLYTIVGNSKILLHDLKEKLHSYKLEINNDMEYKKHFEKIISPRIQNLHKDTKQFYCAFCSNLEKSLCHKFCFKCKKNYFEECGILLPGTFPFMSNYPDSEGKETIPWTLIKACDKYSSLDTHQYFKNFNVTEQEITIAFYESIEGLYLGICWGKRPCHICASVNIEIYNSCIKDKNFDIEKPCSKVLENITKEFYYQEQ